MWGHPWLSLRLPVAVAQAKTKAMSYTNYFADALTAEAERDSRIVAVHAAMAGGTGLYRWGLDERWRVIRRAV